MYIPVYVFVDCPEIRYRCTFIKKIYNIDDVVIEKLRATLTIPDS